MKIHNQLNNMSNLKESNTREKKKLKNGAQKGKDKRPTNS